MGALRGEHGLKVARSARAVRAVRAQCKDSRIGCQHWVSTLGVHISCQHWGSIFGVNMGCQNSLSTCGSQQWDSTLGANMGCQHFLHPLTMQSSLIEPGRPVIFTCSTRERVDATMKGPLEKGDQFAVLEYMKGGQMVTHPCAPLPRIEFRHLQVASMCNCSAWCMIARRVSKPNICRFRILHCLC